MSSKPYLSLLILLLSFTSSFASYHPYPLNPIWDRSRYYRSTPTFKSADLYSRTYRGSFYKTTRSKSTSKIVNVDGYGARGDGSDDSQAFEKAWSVACSSSNDVVLVVPKRKTYLLKPIKFSGPCNSSITFMVYGTIMASNKRSDYQKDLLHWIEFQNVNNFKLDGGGTINGNGKIWWQNSCKINKNLPCKHAPTAVTFHECNNIMVTNLRLINAQQMHLIFQESTNVNAVNLQVLAPGNSPNTDGIHVTDSQGVMIKNSVIRTGDDCISIVSGSKNVRAMDITCGPGHGISIGSLGADNQEAEVSNIFVNRARLSGTTNGVRIKTWQGGSGYARNIVFQNILMHNVSNPIIIDQHYCDQDSPCKEQGSAVKISNVAYKNIKGTSASELAIKFDCSKSFGCEGILVQDVNLASASEEKAQASCQNVNLHTVGGFYPRCA